MTNLGSTTLSTTPPTILYEFKLGKSQIRTLCNDFLVQKISSIMIAAYQSRPFRHGRTASHDPFAEVSLEAMEGNQRFGALCDLRKARWSTEEQVGPERCSCLDRVDLECGYLSTVQRLDTAHLRYRTSKFFGRTMLEGNKSLLGISFFAYADHRQIDSIES